MAVVLLYLANIWIAFLALRKVDLARLQFIDGIVLGLTYYITIPFAIILLYGRVGPDFLPLPDYRPYDDISTTSVILIGSAAIYLWKAGLSGLFPADIRAGARRLAPRLPVRKAQATVRAGEPPRAHALQYLSTLIAVLIVVDLGSAVYAFKAAGIGSGGHWYHSVSDMMAGNTSFVFVKYAQNYARTAVFGALAMMSVYRPNRKLSIALTGSFLAVADLFLTFNRITVVYLFIMFLVMYRRNVRVATAAIFLILFSGIYISSVWPEFRGRVSESGYSLTGMADALTLAMEGGSVQRPLVDEMNGMFESVSFPVLNWIVKNYDAVNVSMGAFLIRPFTVFVPRSVWAARPTPFGSFIGANFADDELAINSFLFGEPYANSWFLWPFLIIAMITLYNAIFRYMARSHPVWGAIGALIGFAWWRFDSSFPAVSTFMSVGLFVGLRIAFGLAAGNRVRTASA